MKYSEFSPEDSLVSRTSRMDEVTDGRDGGTRESQDKE
jgi:hypothetical protein